MVSSCSKPLEDLVEFSGAICVEFSWHEGEEGGLEERVGAGSAQPEALHHETEETALVEAETKLAVKGVHSLLQSILLPPPTNTAIQ